MRPYRIQRDSLSEFLKDHNSSRSKSRIAYLIASLRLGYFLARTNSSSPSTASSGKCTVINLTFYTSNKTPFSSLAINYADSEAARETANLKDYHKRYWKDDKKCSILRRYH